MLSLVIIRLRPMNFIILTYYASSIHQKDLVIHLMNRGHQSVKMKFNGANGIHYYSMSSSWFLGHVDSEIIGLSFI